MSNYRRRFVPGGTYFFSVHLRDQQSSLLVGQIDLLRAATRLCKKRWPFDIDAAVILPNKLHMIWTLPPDDAAYSKRWRLIKSTFSRHCPAPASDLNLRQGEKGIWQRRFWEHHLKDADDFEAHRQMILKAPVQAGLVRHPQDWSYSSIHRAIRNGEYKPNTPVGQTSAPRPIASTLLPN